MFPKEQKSQEIAARALLSPNRARAGINASIKAYGKEARKQVKK